jgi:hypothetical protein
MHFGAPGKADRHIAAVLVERLKLASLFSPGSLKTGVFSERKLKSFDDFIASLTPAWSLPLKNSDKTNFQ